MVLLGRTVVIKPNTRKTSKTDTFFVLSTTTVKNTTRTHISVTNVQMNIQQKPFHKASKQTMSETAIFVFPSKRLHTYMWHKRGTC